MSKKRFYYFFWKERKLKCYTCNYMMREEIARQLKKVLQEFAIEGVEPRVVVSENPSHGDYSSNIALIISKQLKKSPIEAAEEIRSKLEKIQDIEKIEVVKPGFINFFLSKEYLLDHLSKKVEFEPA